MKNAKTRRWSYITMLGFSGWSLIKEIEERGRQQLVAHQQKIRLIRELRPKKRLPVFIQKPYQRRFTGLRFRIGGEKK